MPETKEEGLERIDGISRKSPPPWWMMAEDHVRSCNADFQTNSQGSSAIDTISSAAPVKPLMVEIEDQEKLSAKQPRFNEIIDWGKKLWEFFFPKAPIAAETTGTSNKPGGDPITGLGSPTLEPPFQIDLKALEQLLKELKELNHQIQEINNESEEDLKKDRSFQSLRGLIEYFKEQKKLHEATTVDRKWEIVFGRNQDKRIRKEQGDVEQIKIETEASRKFWSDFNWYLSWGSMAGTAVLVGTVAYTTFGAGVIVIPAVIQIGMNVSKCAIDLTSGGTMLMKSILDAKVGGMKEKIEILNARHLKISFIIKLQADQMNAGWNTAEKLTKEMIDLLRNYREAVQNINGK